MFLKFKKSIVIFSFIASSFPMMNANAGLSEYCRGRNVCMTWDKMFRSSSMIIEKNQEVLENMMNYYNIRYFYPNITESIAQELKDDMRKYLPTNEVTCSCELYSLVDLVLDSNGNLRNTRFSTLRSILGG